MRWKSNPSVAMVLGVTSLFAVTYLLGDHYPMTAQSLGLGSGVLLLVFGGCWYATTRNASRSLCLGPADWITLLRLVLVAALVCTVSGIADLDAPSVWGLVLIAGAALVMDALDGWIARRTRTVSAFGARFDMETDAVLIMVLATQILLLDKAGGWVLLAGALRYAFVAAGNVWRWLRKELPASRRRKVVCALQITALILCLSPAVDSPTSTVIAAIGVGVLTMSFALDVDWLRRHRDT